MAADEITPYTYVVRAYPTRSQHARFARCLRHTRELYNAALEERIGCYERLRERYGQEKIRILSDDKRLATLRRKYGDAIPPELLERRWKEIAPEVKRWLVKTGKWIEVSNAGQARGLTELRRDEPENAEYPRRLQRWAINLVDAAYKGMFTRHRQGARGKQIGFPRFRGAVFWNTIGWDSPVDFTMRERGLHNAKSFGGTLRLRPDRDLPPWDRCTAARLVRDGDRWFAHLSYEVPAADVKQKPTRPVGIDIGLKQPVMRSDGVAPDMPRAAEADVAAKRRAAKALAVRDRRGPKRSKRRQRLRERLRRIENRIARRRRARQHVISARLVHHFDAVAVEDLNLRGLNRGGGGGAQGRGVRKSWRDRAPGALLTLLEWKAKREGRQFVRVDPRGTSINCSQCGARVPKRLRDRTHCCTECGVVLDRDHNAALNVLARAGWGPGVANAGVRVSRNSAAPGAASTLKHDSDAVGPRRIVSKKSRSPPSPPLREHARRSVQLTLPFMR
jgi:putative transposase